MKIIEDRVNKLTNLTDSEIEKYLLSIKEYRPYDPGLYLYGILLSKNKNIFDKENIKLIYITLKAWNMNSRGAELSDFDDFYKSIRNNKKDLQKLRRYRIEKLDNNGFNKVIKLCENLFKNLQLINPKDSKNPPKLVTYSKTLHFIAPHLIVPIDRKYTLNFLTGYENYNNKKSFEIFIKFHEEFIKLAKKSKIQRYKDEHWNQNIPKKIDNLMIRYVTKNGYLKNKT